MTALELEAKFYEVIAQKAIYNRLEGISKDVIYNWKNHRGAKPSFGEMLHVLYQLHLITISYGPRRIS